MQRPVLYIGHKLCTFRSIAHHRMNCSRRDFAKQASLLALGSLAYPSLAGARTTYTVQAGDTLGHIALRHGVSTPDLRRANNLNSDLIRVGQKLTIPDVGTAATGNTPPPNLHTYIVKAGDTLGSIALIHGTSVAALKRTNNLQSDVIRIGQPLRIPGTVADENYLSRVRSETARISVRRDNWRRIVVHHSAIKHGNAAIYDRAHRRRNMQNGLAYHFIIGNGIDSGDGEIEVGPRWRNQLLGGHVRSYQINLTAIGICLVGNFEIEHPSRRQLDAFVQLMDWLRDEVIPGAREFAGHRDLRGEQTICPGKNFPLAAMHARYS
ncbi:MAG: LysM peptidoglycan-binding domain-containing protein [Puniceicoccaceae bacterium]|nr:MAG: LysM peptidoglycan-binding domain-containing protein [Puniceicoccaceae bacterium]